MITFEAVDAGHGDCILLRYHSGADGIDPPHERILLIDAGPTTAKHMTPGAKSFRPLEDRLAPRLAAIKQQRDGRPVAIEDYAGKPTLKLDLVVCTHIDADHIDGVEQIYDCLAEKQRCVPGMPPLEIGMLWFNSFSALLGDQVKILAKELDRTAEAVAVSVADGDNLTSSARTIHGGNINSQQPGKLIAMGQVFDGPFSPAKITVLNPDKTSLEKLRKEWKEKSKIAAAEGVPAAIQSTIWLKKDQSVANLSSITMLVEHEGRKILLTGDQLGKDVLRSLKQSGLMAPPDKIFHVDILKVPHHGAIGNNQPEFMDAVTADTYVFCAIGKDQNPDPPVVEHYARLALSGRKFTMAFTNGDLSYEPHKNGKLPTDLAGEEVATLQELIARLKAAHPKIRDNVTFVFRDKNKPSLVFELPKRG